MVVILKDWYPTTLAGQREMWAAILANIDAVNNTLHADLTRIQRLKDMATVWLSYYDTLQLNRAGVKSQGNAFGIIKGGEKGVDPMPSAPTYHNLNLPAGDFVGLETELRDFRDWLTGLFEWSDEMGDLLKMNGTETEPDDDDSLVLTIGKIQGNIVPSTAVKNGADGFEYQYREAGTEMWQPLRNSGDAETNLELPPTAPDAAKKYEIRAIRLKNFKRIGEWSATYDVAVG